MNSSGIELTFSSKLSKKLDFTNSHVKDAIQDQFGINIKVSGTNVSSKDIKQLNKLLAHISKHLSKMSRSKAYVFSDKAQKLQESIPTFKHFAKSYKFTGSKFPKQLKNFLGVESEKKKSGKKSKLKRRKPEILKRKDVPSLRQHSKKLRKLDNILASSNETREKGKEVNMEITEESMPKKLRLKLKKIDSHHEKVDRFDEMLKTAEKEPIPKKKKVQSSHWESTEQDSISKKLRPRLEKIEGHSKKVESFDEMFGKPEVRMKDKRKIVGNGKFKKSVLKPMPKDYKKHQPQEVTDQPFEINIEEYDEEKTSRRSLQVSKKESPWINTK